VAKGQAVEGLFDLLEVLENDDDRLLVVGFVAQEDHEEGEEGFEW